MYAADTPEAADTTVTTDKTDGQIVDTTKATEVKRLQW